MPEAAALPPPVRHFLSQDPGAVVLDPTTQPGLLAQVAVLSRDVVSLKQVACPHGVLTRVVGLHLAEGAAAPVVVPRPEWPPLRSLRSRRAKGGPQAWWTVLRFAAPVDLASVLAEVAAQAQWGRPGAWSVLDAAVPDIRVINPIGFLVDAREAPRDLSDLDLGSGVTSALVASLRGVQGVRVGGWSPESAGAVEALCLSGVPVVVDNPAAVGAPAGLATGVAQALDCEVDLTDSLAREEHSLVVRRAAYDAVTARSGAGAQPSVSVLLATKRSDMLDFAITQVARQRGVAQLELVLAPHGFSPDLQRVQDLVGPHVSVQVLPQPEETLFGDVLEAAARAATGDVVLKMDDDDWYAPDVIADLLRARGYSGAEMVGMPAELHYLTEQDLTVKRGHPVEFYARFVAGGTMLLDRSVLREVGGFRSVKKFVDAQLIASVLAAGGALYRTHGLGYVLRRNPSGHTWHVDLDYLLDPERTAATWPGFRPSRLLEPDPRHLP